MEILLEICNVYISRIATYNSSLTFNITGVAYSESFDADLMISLIINLTHIIPPKNGFNNLPLKEETTPASDLARIKWFTECQFLYDTIDADHFYTVCKDISSVSVFVYLYYLLCYL